MPCKMPWCERYLKHWWNKMNLLERLARRRCSISNGAYIQKASVKT